MLLPIFPLDVVAFPGMTVPLYVFEARYSKLVRTLLNSEDRRFVMVLGRPRMHDRDEPPMHGVGTVMDVAQVEERSDGTFELIAHAGERVHVRPSERDDVPEPDGSLRALYYTEFMPYPLERGDPNAERLAAWDALEAFRRYAATVFAFDAQRQIDEHLPDDPLYQASLVCANLRVASPSRQVLLESASLLERFALAQKLIEERLRVHAPLHDEDV